MNNNSKFIFLDVGLIVLSSVPMLLVCSQDKCII